MIHVAALAGLADVYLKLPELQPEQLQLEPEFPLVDVDYCCCSGRCSQLYLECLLVLLLSMSPHRCYGHLIPLDQIRKTQNSIDVWTAVDADAEAVKKEKKGLEYYVLKEKPKKEELLELSAVLGVKMKWKWKMRLIDGGTLRGAATWTTGGDPQASWVGRGCALFHSSLLFLLLYTHHLSSLSQATSLTEKK